MKQARNPTSTPRGFVNRSINYILDETSKKFLNRKIDRENKIKQTDFTFVELKINWEKRLNSMRKP